MRRTLLSLVRLMSAVALIAVATYYLLASIPFSYYHFLQFPHFAWMPLFIRFHPLLVVGAMAGLLGGIRGVTASLRRWIRYAAIAGSTTALCMGATVWFPASLSFEVAAALSFAPLVLLGWASAIELAARRTLSVSPPRPRPHAVAVVAALAGTLCSIVYLLQGWVRGASVGVVPEEIAFAGSVSLLAHVAVFTLTALAISGLRAVAIRRSWPAVGERLAVGAAAAAVLALLIRRSLMTALILSDLRAAAVPAILAAAIVLFCLSWIGEMPTRSRARWFVVATAAIVIGVCVAVIPRMLLLADWGSTLQKLLVLATWTGCMLLATALPAGRSKRLVLAAAVAMVLVAIGGSVVVAARDQAPRPRDSRVAIDLSLAIERYATFDTSFAVLMDVFRPMVSDGEFYDVLRRVGDATDDRSLSSVPLRLGVEPHGRPAYRPHIFIFVIDSLRPDYLSAYNPSVTFTPAIGAFAKESVMMRQAFTPYAGTALSQPAIWAGGLIQRAMYVKPFSEVNNLERLVRSSGYQAYISVDEILSVILDDWPDMVRLDSHLTHPERKDQMFKFDLCSTVTELTQRLDRETMETPVFFYSQPQSLHIRVLAGDEYPGEAFRRSASTGVFKPAAAALGRIDACFGGLVDYLKQRHVYDDSVIVLTSDHGDSYGEAGRWGHAFYVAPEILRIPLIIHVPARLKDEGRWNVDAVAMLTDLTPTLYDLLGLKAAALNEVAGRTLMSPVVGESPAVRDMYVVQSSYSRVFGLIDGAGRWMYTADANHQREEFYDLRGGRESEGKTLLKSDRLRYRKWLLERLRVLDRYYGRPLDH